MISLHDLADRTIHGNLPSRTEVLSVMSDELDVLEVVAAAARVRRHFFGRRVTLNSLIPLQRGSCPTDCSYCSQRMRSMSPSRRARWIDDVEAVEAVEQAVRQGAKRICLVAGGRGESDLDRLCHTIGVVRDRQPRVEICVGLGPLTSGQADRLRAAGAHAYDHNLGTIERNHHDLSTLPTFADRVTTVAQVASSGMSPSSGAVFGLGESDDHVVDVAFGLRGLFPDSVPVDFLTVPESRALTPERCLRILAVFRFCLPDVAVGIGNGREQHLRGLQSLGLHVADSLYLGERPDGVDAELRLIDDAGFVVDDVRDEIHDDLQLSLN